MLAPNSIRSSHRRFPVKTVVLKKIRRFYRKISVFESLFIQVAGLQAFILMNICERLLLYYKKVHRNIIVIRTFVRTPQLKCKHFEILLHYIAFLKSVISMMMLSQCQV